MNTVSSICRTVPVKDASVIIAISAVHRKEAIDAVCHSIDTLKAQVPIWKKVYC